MAVVAAEVFVLRHLVRYLHGAHTRVCVSVCVCRRGTRHKLCESLCNAPSPQPTDKLENGGEQRPIEGGSGGHEGHEVRTLLKGATNRVGSMEGLVARCLDFYKHSTH